MPRRYWDWTPPFLRPHASYPASCLPRRVISWVANGELGRLDQLADAATAAEADSGTVVITAIGGTAGIGKTMTAVYWAHRASARFPDGQLYVNLRGFDPAGAPMAPAEAMRGFLDALGVPPEKLPQGLSAQTGLFRSLLADRRLLVVLDNAANVEQVRPLLPGAPRCLAVVTSRSRLTGLVAEHGAHPVPLDLLSLEEATHLLSWLLGSERVEAEPEAVATLVDLCAQLPLALSVVAAQAQQNPDESLGFFASELTDVRRRLDLLDTEDPHTTPRAVFSWSYDAQPTTVRTMFRLLGVHPGPDISVPAAASLAGVTIADAAHALAVLARAHLVEEHSPGRYSFHDLLRVYAAELAEARQPERRAAEHRMVDHYLQSAYAGITLVNPNREPLDLSPPQPGVIPEAMGDHAQISAWFDAERRVMEAVVRAATAAGLRLPGWQLADLITRFYERSGSWHEAIEIALVGAQAAELLRDRTGLALLHRRLGYYRGRLGEYAAADLDIAKAIALSRDIDDLVGLAKSYQIRGFLHSERDRYPEAVEAAEAALQLFRSSGDRTGEGRILGSMAWHSVKVEDYPQAVAYSRQAIAVIAELGDARGLGGNWHTLGYAHHHLGDAIEAERCYQQAFELFAGSGDHYYSAVTLRDLGDARDAAGNHSGAVEAWERALELFEEAQPADAEKVRARLARAGARRP